MPALQVRDFPDDLYEQLKAYAASQHRSIAQQTIVAVEQMLEAADAQHYWDGHDLHRLERRIEKRKELFAEIDKLPKFDVPDDFPDTVELIRQGREERDAIIDAMIAAEKQKAVEA